MHRKRLQGANAPSRPKSSSARPAAELADPRRERAHGREVVEGGELGHADHEPRAGTGMRAQRLDEPRGERPVGGRTRAHRDDELQPGSASACSTARRSISRPRPKRSARSSSRRGRRAAAARARGGRSRRRGGRRPARAQAPGRRRRARWRSRSAAEPAVRGVRKTREHRDRGAAPRRVSAASASPSNAPAGRSRPSGKVAMPAAMDAGHAPGDGDSSPASSRASVARASRSRIANSQPLMRASRSVARRRHARRPRRAAAGIVGAVGGDHDHRAGPVVAARGRHSGRARPRTPAQKAGLSARRRLRALP